MTNTEGEDPFLETRLTDFVDEGGIRGKVGPTIGLPSLVPLAQYGKYFKEAASEASRPVAKFPPSPVPSVASTNLQRPLPSTGTKESSEHLIAQASRNLTRVDFDDSSSTPGETPYPKPLVEGDHAEETPTATLSPAPSQAPIDQVATIETPRPLGVVAGNDAKESPTPELELGDSSESEDEVLNLSESLADDHYVRRSRPSVVREYDGFLDELDDISYQAEKEEEDQNGLSLLPAANGEISNAPILETKAPGMQAKVAGGTEGAEEHQSTPEFKYDEGRFVGDLGEYADTSWSLISPKNGGVNQKQYLGLGDATPPQDITGDSEGAPASAFPSGRERNQDSNSHGRDRTEPLRQSNYPPYHIRAKPESSPLDEQGYKLLRWFRKHEFGREIDCNFKLRHKIANGYMVGACLAHYYPGLIHTVDFNRGSSPASKVANWDFVQKFFKRRGYSLTKDSVKCLCTVPMSMEAGVAAACRVLSELYSFLLADSLVPPLSGIVPARVRPPPPKPKVSIYKRFTDRRRSDLDEEELIAAEANASRGRNKNLLVGGRRRRSSSVPAASTRMATLIDAEEFHKSRQTVNVGGRLKEADGHNYGVKEDESEGLQERRRSYAASEKLVDVDPITGEDLPGHGGEREDQRERKGLDYRRDRRDDGRENERKAQPYETLGSGWGGGEEGERGGKGSCPGCGRCTCCGRIASYQDKTAVGHRFGEKLVADRVRDHNHARGAAGRGGEDGGACAVGRRSREEYGQRVSDSSSTDGRQRCPSRHGCRRRCSSESIGQNHLRHTIEHDDDHVSARGHQSDPSGGGRRNPRSRFRQLPPRQRGGNTLENKRHHRQHRDGYFECRPIRIGKRIGSKHDGRSQRGALGYSSDGASYSSSEEETVSPRRRRANRETAAGAAEASAREIPRVVRHRSRDKHSSGGGVVEVLPATLSNPRQHLAAGLPNKTIPARRDGRHGGRGPGADNLRSGEIDAGDGDSGGVWQDNRSLPPPTLPEETTRRLRDRSTAASAAEEGCPDDHGSRRRVVRRVREEELEAVGRPGFDHSGIGGRRGRVEKYGTSAAGLRKGGGGRERSGMESYGRRRRNNAYNSGEGGGARTQPAILKASWSGKILGGAKDGLMRSKHYRRERLRREGVEGGGPHVGGTCSREPAVAGSTSPSTQRSPRSRSQTSNLCLDEMSGFGPGDGGWSERVESRRQQQLVQLSNGVSTTVAKVNVDSGKVQPLTPSAPPSQAGHHHQAVSPPRLRRLVRPKAGDGTFEQRLQQARPQQRVSPPLKRVGFDSYAEAAGLEVGVRWD